MDGSERPKLEITKQAKDQVAFRIASELQKKLGTTTILPTARADELTAEQLRNPAIQAELLSAMHVARHTAGTDEGVTRKNVDDEIREFIHKDILGYSKDDPLKETDTREALEERAAELFQVAAAKLSRFYRGYKDRRDLKEHFQKNINESKQVQRKTYPLGGPKDSLRNVDEVDDLGVPETTEDVDATAAAARLKEIRENIAKRQLEEAKKAQRVRAATAIQAVWRGRRVREEIAKANKLPEPPAPDPVPDRDPAPPRAPASGMVLGVYPPEDPRHLPATIIQTAFRGYQARKNFKKLQDDSRVQAAITIQRAWRRYRGKIAARRPENYPKIADDLARIEEGRAAEGIDKFTGYPKDLDRGQIAAEATAAFVGKRFDPSRGKFVDVTGPQRSLQNHMLIDGIYGHQPKARGAKDEHLSIGRSPAYPTDSLELHASGFIIAKYQGLTELQHAISKRRRQHYLANKEGKSLLAPGEVRVGFVSHPRYQFNARGERVDTDNDQTILLIETAEDGLTEVFADAKVMQDIHDRCHRTFADPKKYKTLMSAALDACKGITDDKERQTAAEKMVREAVRDMVMKEMVQEIKQARERLNVPALTDMQVHDITRTTGGGHKFEGGLKAATRCAKRC